MTTKQKVEVILQRSVYQTKKDLAAQLGISRPTLDSRLEKDNWKKLETFWINYIFNKLNQTK